MESTQLSGLVPESALCSAELNNKELSVLASMQDNLVPARELRLRSVKNASAKLVELCKEYFEISIGYRRPTEDEKDKARLRLLKGGLFGDTLTPEGQVKVMKYPLSTDQRPLVRMFYQLEYYIFDTLARKTSLIDGPFVPMLRYELAMQEELKQKEEYDTAVLRQSAFLETYIKMKMNQWKDSAGNFIPWELCLASAYRGEDLIREAERNKLRELAKVRNRFAHDWRALAMRPRCEIAEIRQISAKGLETISALYGREMKRAYEDYTSDHISESLPTKWKNRATAEVRSRAARVTVQITCEHCDRQFYPHNEGWKRCPECDTPHDWLEESR